MDTEVPGIFRIENDDTLIHVDSAANAGTAEDALNNCFITMMEELIEELGLGQREAYVQMSVNPAITVRVYQFVNPGFFTFGVKLDKELYDQFS